MERKMNHTDTVLLLVGHTLIVTDTDDGYQTECFDLDDHSNVPTIEQDIADGVLQEIYDLDLSDDTGIDWEWKNAYNEPSFEIGTVCIL